ncbi:MAG: hypothetical protein ACJ75R_01165 [Solirubrobacterales bacterium]
MRKIRLMVGCAAVAAAGVGVLGCGDSGSDSSGPATFTNDAYPFTFEYPSSFALSNDVTLNQNLGAQTEDNLALALDNSNGILLQKANLNVTVTKANLEAAKRQFDVLVARIDPGASGKATEIGGFPALEYGAIPVSSVPDGQSVITFLFQGQTEYVVNCQSTPDHRSEIDAACDQALGTLKPAH